MRTVCCSNECERRFECANHSVNNEGTNACEDYYRFGSASLSSYGFDETWWCSELGDWAMFAPIEKINMEVNIKFPFQYLEQYIRGEISLDGAVDRTIEEVYRLIGEYVEKHNLKTNFMTR